MIVRKNDGILLDVGESDNINERITYHDRKNCWINNSSTTGYYIYATVILKETDRLELESKIRIKFNPICGEK